METEVLAVGLKADIEQSKAVFLLASF